MDPDLTRAVCEDSVNSTFVRNANASLETQFCTDFSGTIPYVFLGISCLSAVCCLCVFATYRLFPRLGGYSSKVFIYR